MTLVGRVASAVLVRDDAAGPVASFAVAVARPGSDDMDVVPVTARGAPVVSSVRALGPGSPVSVDARLAPTGDGLAVVAHAVHAFGPSR